MRLDSNGSLIGSDAIIVAVIAGHLFEAGIVLSTTAANGSIEIAALLSVLYGSRRAVVTALSVAAALAMVGQWKRCLSPPARMVCLMGQFSLLTITGLAAFLATIHGHYADGVLRSWQFVACDQMPRMAAPLLYFVAVLARLKETNGHR